MVFKNEKRCSSVQYMHIICHDNNTIKMSSVVEKGRLPVKCNPTKKSFLYQSNFKIIGLSQC